jgi:hypothetical protein
MSTYYGKVGEGDADGEVLPYDAFLNEYLATLMPNESKSDDGRNCVSYSWSLKDAPTWTHGPIEIDTTSGYVSIKGNMFDNSMKISVLSSNEDEASIEYSDDYDDCPDWLKDALCSLETDNVIPEWELVYLTQYEFVKIDDTVVATDEYQFDSFECGFHEPTRALCVRVYDNLPESARNVDKPPVIVCATCDCGISTYGLIGDVATCEHCGALNSVYPKTDEQDDKQSPGTLTTNQLKQVNGRYGLWQHILP